MFRTVSISLLLLASGCALLPGDTSTTAAPGGPSPMRDGLNEYRATFHCHCYLSHDSEGPPEVIAAAARLHGLAVVLLTDHYEPGNVGRSPHGVSDGVLFLPGVEVRLAKSEGSILAVGLREEIETEPRETLPRRLRDQGAFLVAGHVEQIAEGYDLSEFDGFEVYNLHAELEQSSYAALAAKAMVQTRSQLVEGMLTPMAGNRERWDRELALGRRLVPFAGHDAHDNVEALGIRFATYPDVFRLFSTRILAAELSEEAVMQGLRAGHVYLGFDYLADAGGFLARVSRPDGGSAIVGETIRWQAGATLQVGLPRHAKVRVLRDGRVWQEGEGHQLTWDLPSGGLYRVEAWLDDRLWIVATPIDVLDQS